MSYQPNLYALLCKATSVDLSVTGDIVLAINNADKYIVKEVVVSNRTTDPIGGGFVGIFLSPSASGTPCCNGVTLSDAYFPTVTSYVLADISAPTYSFGVDVQSAQTLYANITAGTVPATIDISVYGIILE